MAGWLRYSRAEAAGEPLTPEGVAHVVAEARLRVLAQLLAATLVAAVLLLAARATGGVVSRLLLGAALLAAWPLLATALALWDHLRTAKILRREAIPEGADPTKFWRAHRGLFPWAWST